MVVEMIPKIVDRMVTTHHQAAKIQKFLEKENSFFQQTPLMIQKEQTVYGVIRKAAHPTACSKSQTNIRYFDSSIFTIVGYVTPQGKDFS